MVTNKTVPFNQAFFDRGTCVKFKGVYIINRILLGQLEIQNISSMVENTLEEKLI